MKRFISTVVAVALGVVLAPQALAATSVQAGPLTGLSSDVVTKIHIALSGYPTTFGLYIEQAVKPKSGTRPDIHGTPIYVSAAPANFAEGATPITGDIVLSVDNGHAWGADCVHQECGIFIRADHNASGNTSEDQFIPLTFVASTTATATPTATPTAAALPADTLAVTINGVAAVANVPGSIQYRTPVTFAVTTGSGVAATLKSYTPDLCPVTGFTVDALKGSGQCDIAVTAPGDATHAAKTSHFPFIVGLGVQTLTERVVKVSIKVPATLTLATNFGETVSYKSSTPKNCSVKGATVKGLKVGTCNLVATAMGVNGNYNAITQKVVVAVTK